MATTKGILIGAPELLLDELELLEELELLLDELELLELLDELDELEDEGSGSGGGPPPPQAVNKDAQRISVSGGVEIAGIKGIRFMKAPKLFLFCDSLHVCTAIPQRTPIPAADPSE